MFGSIKIPIMEWNDNLGNNGENINNMPLYIL